MSEHTLTVHRLEWSNASIHTWQLTPTKARPDVVAVILHGAGTADSSRSLGLARAYADAGIAVIALDFVGHGKTGGDISQLSLHKRTEQALAAINHWTTPDQHVILCGFSMSGYTVLRLTKLLPGRVRAISLLSPAIYSKAAEDIPFTEQFTAAIRQPESWRDSLALDDAQDFTGRVHIMISARDEVIPWGVIELLLQHLRYSAQEIRLDVVTGVEHKLAQWLSRQPDRCRSIIDYLLLAEPPSQS